MINLTIIVNNVDAYIGMAFTHVRIYTSTTEADTYTYLMDIPLVVGRTKYSYTHATGTDDTWYKSSIYDNINDRECCWSDPIKGVCPALYHYATYPCECDYDEDDSIIIRKIRRLIGDLEGLNRLYIDGSDEYTLSSALQPDKYTIDLNEKGWPVHISLNDIAKTSLSDPVVQGYQYLTFSGTLNSGIENDMIDIWYYTFKFSDREVYEAYGDAMIPPGLTSSNVTQDHLILQASIDLLENMASADIVEDGAVIRDDQTVYDPSPGLAERDRTIKRLRAMLDDLIKQFRYDMSDLTGVLID